jgi:hypothetical protein
VKRALAAAVLLIVLTGISGAAASVSGTVPTIKSIKLPGNKVQCVLTGPSASGPGGALCVAVLNPGVKGFPKRNCMGTGDTGGGLQMGAKGKVKGICLSENPFVPPVRLLRYGRTITVGGVACVAVSRRVGVRCENANLHGWQISPSRWKKF